VCASGASTATRTRVRGPLTRACRRPGAALTAARRPGPPSGNRSPASESAPPPSHGVTTRPSRTRATTSSSQASGASSSSAACSHTQRSACSEPQLCPTVARQPATSTRRESNVSRPLTMPSGSGASSFVRGTGAR
jgi:hypothetical protein